MKRNLLPLLDQFEGTRVAVIGDVMLDHSILGDVSRVSPEAPVPVLHVSHEMNCPGGAGNVACNLDALGARVYVFGVTGADDAREELLCCLEGMSTKGLIVDPNRYTTIKSRVVGRGQQLLRMDWEEGDYISAAIAKKLLSELKRVIKSLDCIVISDYQKGVCSPSLIKQVIALANKHKVPTIVDPKKDDISVYKGCTIIKPNYSEALRMTGLDSRTSDEKLCKAIAKKTKSHVLITLGERGMVVYDGKVSHIRTQAKEVFDVTGAGDTVSSALSLSLSNGASLHDAAVVANYAAGLAVGKLGTSTVTVDELKQGSLKLQSLQDMVDIADHYHELGTRIVFTNGCFDLMHAGHVHYLQAAKEHGDVLIIGLNSDKSVRAIKGSGRPLIGEKDRVELLSALSCVDYVVIFDSKTPVDIVKALKPDVYVKGGDWKEKDLPEAKIVKSYKGKVVIVPHLRGLSTTGLVASIVEKSKNA